MGKVHIICPNCDNHVGNTWRGRITCQSCKTRLDECAMLTAQGMHLSRTQHKRVWELLDRLAKKKFKKDVRDPLNELSKIMGRPV